MPRRGCQGAARPGRPEPHRRGLDQWQHRSRYLFERLFRAAGTYAPLGGSVDAGPDQAARTLPRPVGETAMSGLATPAYRAARGNWRVKGWSIAAAVVLVFVLANAHLLYLAFTSRPDCA